MTTLVLISHGNFAEGIRQSVEMIMGPLSNTHTVTLAPQDGPETFKEKLATILSENPGRVVVFADLLGGTPCNVALSLATQYPEMEIYTGMNLGMLIAFVNEQLLQQPVDYVNSAKESIVNVRELLATMSDDDDE